MIINRIIVNRNIMILNNSLKASLINQKKKNKDNNN